MANPKTLKELNLLNSKQLQDILGIRDIGKYKSLGSYLSGMGVDYTKDILSKLKGTVKEEEKRLLILKSIDKILKDITTRETNLSKFINKEISQLEELVSLDNKRNKAQKALNDLKQSGNDQLRKAIENNKELFRIAHEMQLESNVTWKNYTKLYEGAYESVRKANKEVGQSIHNVKDLVNMQNKLLGAGWKNIDTNTLTNVSASVMTLQRALGSMDARLITAFEHSYRLFGEKTDKFVTSIGNRLNAFSNTFGVSIGMLQGAVSSMAISNNFIHRSNMQANLKANESLIKAAALSGAIGLADVNFLSQLAKTSQYGTMEQMSGIFQGGALLEGFDTAGFQRNMVQGNYEGATSSLFSSIASTLGGIDDHYLRAEYMNKIGSSFGLSQDDLLAITTNGGDLQKYSTELQTKLLGINTSMKDELKDLRVNLVDRIENAIQNFWGSEKLGSVMQEMGLYGLEGEIADIATWVKFIALKDTKLGSGISNILSKGGVVGASGIGARLGFGIAGVGIMAGSNLLGSSIQKNVNATEGEATLGALAGILGSTAGGALTGTMIGGGIPGAVVGGAIGLGLGIANAVSSDKERKSKLQELEDSKRAARAQAAGIASTGDPVVDAINAQTVAIVNAVTDSAESQKEIALILDTEKRTTTYSYGG